MATANAYNGYHHTLNDYRIVPDLNTNYESDSSSKIGGAALVLAVFLGVGGYFYYSSHRSVESTPADGVNYQAPAATDSALPSDTVDNTVVPEAADPAALAPAPIDPALNAAPSAPAQDATLNRTPASKPSTAPAQPAQRAKQAPKAVAPETVAPSTAAPAPATTDSIAPAAPETTMPSITQPVEETQPSATESEVPAAVTEEP
ncbi:MAG: hypothetical protein QM808_04900 [Steroidobacteraceae bacterium]